MINIKKGKNNLCTIEKVVREVRDEVMLINERLKGLEENINNVSKIENSKYTIINTIYQDNPFFWVCSRDADDSITKMAREGKVFLDSEIFEMFNQKQGTFMDIGANIGAFALPFAAKGWNGYAFEASSINADVLQKSIELNNFNITLLQTAVYDKTGSVYFVQNGPWGFVKNKVFEKEKYEELRAISLDDWYANSNIDNVDLIKIDIEGSEAAALRGAHQMLKALNYPPIYTEVNAFALALQNETPFSYFSIAEEMGYQIFEIFEGKLYEYDKTIFPIEFCRDYILLRDIPDYLKARTYGRIANNDGRKEKVFQRLKNYEKWMYLDNYGNDKKEEAYDSYLLFCLKDYPDFLTDEIKNILLLIKEKGKGQILIQDFLRWI